jgi:hypothetical protein
MRQFAAAATGAKQPGVHTLWPARAMAFDTAIAAGNCDSSPSPLSSLNNPLEKTMNRKARKKPLKISRTKISKNRGTAQVGGGAMVEGAHPVNARFTDDTCNGCNVPSVQRGCTNEGCVHRTDECGSGAGTRNMYRSCG